LIIKVFSFRFVSQFGTVYYYAFVSTGTKEAIENGIIRMGTSVMVFTTVAHWWTIFLQVYVVMFVRFVRRRRYQRKLRSELKNIELLEEDHVTSKRSDAEAREIRLMNKRMLLDQAQDELWFEIMNPPHDSFQEYIASVVQFSFVACFTVVLPIAPLLVLINFLLNMRFDAYKLCRGRRRPLAKRTGGIGIWEHLLHIVAVIAVLTNCWLIAYTNADFVWLAQKVGPMATVFIVVAWEHVMLLIKYMMTVTISPLPKEIRDEIKRKQHSTEQERYANMRLKTERSRRTKLQKGSSFASPHSRSGSAIFHDCQPGSSSPSRFLSPKRAPQNSLGEPKDSAIPSPAPQFDRGLCTIPSIDEDSVSVAGQLYEC
jgi:Calcium-activated chloride channel